MWHRHKNNNNIEKSIHHEYGWIKKKHREWEMAYGKRRRRKNENNK